MFLDDLKNISQLTKLRAMFLDDLKNCLNLRATKIIQNLEQLLFK